MEDRWSVVGYLVGVRAAETAGNTSKGSDDATGSVHKTTVDAVVLIIR
jgi:hypothetical protein